MFQEQHFSWISATAEDEKESEGVKKKNVADGICCQDDICHLGIIRVNQM